MRWLAHLPWRQRPKMFGRQQAQALGLRIKEAPAEKAPGLRRSRQDALLTRVKGCSLAVGAPYTRVRRHSPVWMSHSFRVP